MATPTTSDFLVVPINGTDLIAFYRGSNISRPLYLSYSNFLAILTQAISGGTPLLLKTNNVQNPVQNVLNLIQGTGITITDNGAGGITIAATGGASFITSISDTLDIDLTVTSSTLSAALTTTGVSIGTYGTATQVPQITVDSKGRITGVTPVNITAGTGSVISVATAGLISGGPITVSGTITTSMASGKLVGRYTAGAGPMEEITVSSGLNLSASGVLTASGTSGVSSVNLLTGVVPLTGTANRLSISAANVFDISTSYVGQATITTLGTIGTGTWQGTAIGTTYGGTGLTSIGSALQYLRVNSGASALEYASLPLTAKGDLFTRTNTADAALALGLNTQVLTVDTSTATGLKWGTNTAPTPLGYYGAFSDITDQFATVINTGYPMLLGVTDLSNGVTVVSGSRVTIANTGIYNIQWSAQFRNPAAAEHDVTIWLRKNGVDVPGSAGVVLVPRKHGSSDGHTLPSWNFLLDVVAGDYYEFVWSTDSTVVFISHEPVGSYAPSTASVVLTVTQQSGIMAGTGMTSLTTAGTSGAASYNNLTGVLNIPIYGGGSGGNSIGQLTSPGDVTTVAATAPSQGLTATLDANYKAGSFGVTFDGGTALITSGKIAYVRVPYKGTITGWQLVADQSGSCSIAVKQGVFSPFPPTTPLFSAALSSAQTNSATSLTYPVLADDWFSFTITGTSAVTWVNLSISITKII